MLYKITNTDRDEFISLILDEMERDLQTLETPDMKLQDVIKEDDETKGAELQAVLLLVMQEIETFSPKLVDMINHGLETVILGIISAGVYDLLKTAVQKYRNLKEYSPEKVLEIEMTDSVGKKITVRVSLGEILHK